MLESKLVCTSMEWCWMAAAAAAAAAADALELSLLRHGVDDTDEPDLCSEDCAAAAERCADTPSSRAAVPPPLPGPPGWEASELCRDGSTEVGCEADPE